MQLTGGIGRSKLTSFYAHHFIFANSPDTQTEVISRTIGIDRVVDEMNFSFTHNQMVDWLYVLPFFPTSPLPLPKLTRWQTSRRPTNRQARPAHLLRRGQHPRRQAIP